jgi:glycosyltransferase 2 family protein
VWIFRAVLIVAVVLGVSGTVRNAWAQLSEQEWHVRPLWLIACGVLYLIGLLPMAWFWYRTLRALGQPAPWPVTLRAYFLGHIGKYVPGKAIAAALRVVAVTKWVPSLRIGVLSVMLETFTMMAVGAVLAAGLSAYLLRSRPELSLIALAVAIVVGVPTFPPVASWLMRFAGGWLRNAAQTIFERGRKTPAVNSALVDIEANLQGITWRLLLEGWLAAAVCWLFLGLSLWAMLRAIGVSDIDLIRTLPTLVAAVAMAVVAGFASMLPGGIGIRDLALIQLLAGTCGSANALVASLLMRLVWLVSEFAACVILYIAAKMRKKRSRQVET